MGRSNPCSSELDNRDCGVEAIMPHHPRAIPRRRGETCQLDLERVISLYPNWLNSLSYLQAPKQRPGEIA
jgi:hypothetical protein